MDWSAFKWSEIGTCSVSTLRTISRPSLVERPLFVERQTVDHRSVYIQSLSVVLIPIVLITGRDFLPDTVPADNAQQAAEGVCGAGHRGLRAFHISQRTCRGAGRVLPLKGTHCCGMAFVYA